MEKKFILMINMKKLIKIKSFFELMRPLEWSKSFGNMVIGALAALGFSFNTSNVFLFLTGFISVALLWSGLYTLNDWTDWKKDLGHKIKKNRAIPSGRVSPNQAIIFSLTLIFSSLIIGTWLFFTQNNFLFLTCLIGMLINQLLYTLEPIRLKTKPVIDLISGSLINPFFRFYAGWVLFSPTLNAPLELLTFILGIQFGGYTLYRLESKKHEEKLGYKSSIVLFPKTTIKTIAYTGIVLGSIGFIYSCFSKALKFEFIYLGLASVLLLPFYYTALKNPEKMNMKKMYVLIFVHYFLFVLGMVVLSLKL